MATTYHCWQCGAALVGMILPVSRRETCRACEAEVHACRQCAHYDARVAGQCREERAEDVTDKDRANFCDYFSPRENPEQSRDGSASEQARAELDALFGGSEAAAGEPAGNPLDDLFDFSRIKRDD